MAEARQRDAWSRTSSLMTLIANAHRDPRKNRPFRAQDFDPFARPNSGPPTAKVGVEALKAVFLGRPQTSGLRL